MKRIVDVPIESLPDRYSTDWSRWFQREYNRLNTDAIIINPKSLSDTIREGSFLDVTATNYYKAQQIAEISEMIYNHIITNDDVFLFHDIWNPAIESLAYIRDGLGMKFKITGCLHAGSYDPHDFLAKKGMGYWAEDIENGWFKIIDKIFVATNFHKRLICEKRKVNPKKIIVTGFPIYYEGKHLPKENIVVFPHRLDDEKNPYLFTETESYFQMIDPKWKFIRTKDVCGTKQEYYNLLERSKIAVSFADQETWGIACLESLFAECLLVVPSRLSYREIYPNSVQFSSFSEAIRIIESMMKDPSKYKGEMKCVRDQQLRNGREAIENMINSIRNGG